MQFITGNSRHQTYFSTLEDQVGTDNAARLMDAFIDKLDLKQLSFKATVQKSEGRPPYAPGVFFQNCSSIQPHLQQYQCCQYTLRQNVSTE